MKISEFRKLIREEVRKVLKEETLEKSVYNGLTDSNIPPNNFIILDMIPGMDGFNKMLRVLKSQKVTSCTVKPGSLDSGYKGFNVVVTLESGNQIKLFIDQQEFSGTDLVKVVKSMTTKPDGKLLASAIGAALQ
jgi:hypothetical protein